MMKLILGILLCFILAGCSASPDEVGEIAQAVTTHTVRLVPVSDTGHYPAGGVECDPTGCYNPDGYWWTGLNDHGSGSSSSAYHVPSGVNDYYSANVNGWGNVNCTTILGVQNVVLRSGISTLEGDVRVAINYVPGAAPFGNSVFFAGTYFSGLNHAAFAYGFPQDPQTGAAWTRQRLGCNTNGTMPQFGLGSQDNGVWFDDIAIDVTYTTP